MKIFVCIKQVPDTETKIKISPELSGIDTNSVKWIINPYDDYALEEAVKLKESIPGSSVTVFSIGPKKRVIDSLRTAFAKGADEGVVIDAPDFIDSLLTSKALAAAIKKEGDFDLIIAGKSALDDNASSVGPMLAQILSIPHTSVVSKLTISENTYVAEREVEGGTIEIAQMKGPSLITATKGLNTPRFASLPAIMKAKSKPIKELDLGILGIDANSSTKFTQFRLPPEKPATKIISGDVSTQVHELVRLLRDEAKAL